MSKPIDYSKFDHIDDDSSDEDGNTANVSAAASSNAVAAAAATHHHHPQDTTAATTAAPQQLQQPQQSPVSRMRKNEKTGRFVYEYNGQAIYEWEQTLEQVILYIPAPPVPNSKHIHCQIRPRRLQLGVQQAIQEKGIYFIDEETFGVVNVDESTWTLEDDDDMLLTIYLTKASKGQVWDLALKGKQSVEVQLDPMAKEQVQKELMLERFQEENPGMDFRGAQFNGSVPDPRTFMGGVKYT